METYTQAKSGSSCAKAIAGYAVIAGADKKMTMLPPRERYRDRQYPPRKTNFPNIPNTRREISGKKYAESQLVKPEYTGKNHPLYIPESYRVPRGKPHSDRVRKIIEEYERTKKPTPKHVLRKYAFIPGEHVRKEPGLRSGERLDHTTGEIETGVLRPRSLRKYNKTKQRNR